MKKLLETLSAISGVNIDEAKELWEKVKENAAKLDVCKGPHDFELVTPELSLRPRYRCTRCKGEVGMKEHRWYNLGLRHGKKRR